jgi:hypothetical protein
MLYLSRTKPLLRLQSKEIDMWRPKEHVLGVEY